MTRAIAARPFHVAVGSLAVGLAASTASRPAMLAVAAGAVGLVLVLARGMPALAALALALVLTGVALGEARLHALDAPAARVRDAPVHRLGVHLLSPPRPNPNRLMAVHLRPARPVA